MNPSDLLIISVLVDQATLNAVPLGYVFELMYQNRVYDKKSEAKIDVISNFKKIPKTIDN